MSNVSKAKTNHRIKDRAKALVIGETLRMDYLAKLNCDLTMIIRELKVLEILHRASGG